MWVSGRADGVGWLLAWGIVWLDTLPRWLYGMRGAAQGHTLSHAVCRDAGPPVIEAGPTLTRSELGDYINQEATRLAPPAAELERSAQKLLDKCLTNRSDSNR